MASNPRASRIAAIVFRITGDQLSWESRLPVEVLRLPAETTRVNAPLDDPLFFAPFTPVLRPGYRSAIDAGGVRSALPSALPLSGSGS
jgi:hypothetical protein